MTALTIISCTVVIVLFWPVIATLIQAWSHSRTYAHGFLIAPASVYLIWCGRNRIPDPDPERWGGLIVLLPISGWLAGWLLQSLLLQQAAVLSMFPCVIFAIWGARVFRKLLLPFGLLAFALPVGSSLEPWLQSITIMLVTSGLFATGIPFDRHGYFITLPSGTWEVASDCAGLRYLLPGLALGYVYVSFMYQQSSARVWFLILCASCLIIANGVRAYGILLSDHLGILDGTDHRVFSYSVYSITILWLGWIGSLWPHSRQGPLLRPSQSQSPSSVIRRRAMINAVCAVALLSLCPFTMWVASMSPQATRTIILSAAI